MNRSLRSAFFAAALVFTAAPLVGCVVTQDGNKLTLESTTLFNGTPVTKSAAYASGKGLKVVGVNGDISVSKGSASDSVGVTFEPFTREKDENESEAVRQMNEDLRLEVSESNNVILLSATKVSGSSSLLGAHIRVTLPAGFDGSFEIDQGNGEVNADLTGGSPASTNVVNSGAGDITVRGAGGAINIAGDFDVDVSVISWPAESGIITAGDQLGDMTFTLPARAAGTMTAQAATLTEPSPLPTGWESAASAENSKSYTMNGGGGGQIDLRALGGNLTIVAN